MKESNEDIWKSNSDIICITVNGNIKNNGELVMGAGIALDAKILDVNVSYYFAESNRRFGNTPCLYRRDNKPNLLSFPTKNNWYEKSDIKLIETSANEIVEIVNNEEKQYDKPIKIGLTRPGCGNGGLNWKDVKPIIKPIFDDKFTVYNISKRK